MICECGCGQQTRVNRRFLFNHHQSRNRKYDTAKFILKANIRHHGKYLYPRTIYFRFEMPSIITCPMHGDFLQLPKLHLTGHGCPDCAKIRSANGRITYRNDRFIEKAKQLHGDRYDYSQVQAIKSENMVTILCRQCKHDFETTPREHLHGKVCPRCSKTKRLTKDQFILAAQTVHGNQYGYDGAVYINQSTKVAILCEKHGVFVQTPRDHIHSAAGCPNCKTSKGEKAVERVLVTLGVKYQRQYKFDECRGKKRKKLRFDFAIFNNGNLGLIEYHGLQHYKPIGPVGFREFLDGANRDEKKRRFCSGNNINLLEIPYYDVKNAHSLISEFVRRL